MSDKTRTRVLVVGAGAAGTVRTVARKHQADPYKSCAATLSNHPDKFHVTLIEAQDVVGGQATSIDIDQKRFGASYLNDGVQGGSGIFRHTFAYFDKYGYSASPVDLQVSFGKGEDAFWTNVFPSPLVKKYSADIRKFGRFLGAAKRLEIAFALMPARTALRLFGMSGGFVEAMVMPLMALFLGTGNQTPHVSAAILARLFQDPNMKLWDYSADTLLPNRPRMYTFPHLSDFYAKWGADLVERGVELRTNTELVEVVERSSAGVRVRIRKPCGEATEESFDELIFAVLADTAKRLLGKSATFMESRVLSGAKFFDDITVTHADSDYIARYYESKFNPDLCAEHDAISDPSEFAPMYFARAYPGGCGAVEMGFDCSEYQPQFRELESAPPERVYQTIFLDKAKSNQWTKRDIDPSKIIDEKTWHQLGHGWKHYATVVPWLMWINKARKGTHTQFAGSWTLVNMHEVACVSGIAAACAIGADYVPPDEFGRDFFLSYYFLTRGARFGGVVQKPLKNDE